MKSLRRLGKGDRERILRGIEGLPAGNVRPLRGHEGEWRLRVGSWRVRFYRHDEQRVIAIVAVSSRGSAYQP